MDVPLPCHVPRFALTACERNLVLQVHANRLSSICACRCSAPCTEMLDRQQDQSRQSACRGAVCQAPCGAVRQPQWLPASPCALLRVGSRIALPLSGLWDVGALRLAGLCWQAAARVLPARLRPAWGTPFS